MWILLYEFYIFLYKSFHMGVSPLNWCFLSLYLSLTSLSWPESFVLLEPETNCFLNFINFTAQKMKFSIKDIFIKCGQICRKLLIWSHLLNKSLMENFIFCSVTLFSKRKMGKIFFPSLRPVISQNYNKNNNSKTQEK